MRQGHHFPQFHFWLQDADICRYIWFIMVMFNFFPGWGWVYPPLWRKRTQHIVAQSWSICKQKIVHSSKNLILRKLEYISFFAPLVDLDDPDDLCLNVARGTTDPGYWLHILSYLYRHSWDENKLTLTFIHRWRWLMPHKFMNTPILVRDWKYAVSFRLQHSMQASDIIQS